MEEWHPAPQEYCEAIYELAEDNISVVQARIAERLDISRPAVSLTIRRLERDGLVSISGTSIHLTESGTTLAEQVVRRHRLAERFLTDMLGLSWAEAHQEAGKWEHIISDRVEAAMASRLGDPTTCPHGNPIPGSGYHAPDLLPLIDIPVGQRFVIRRIPEELEFVDGQLEFLERSGLVPDQEGELTALGPDGTVTVLIEDLSIGIGSFASKRIQVTAAQ